MKTRVTACIWFQDSGLSSLLAESTEFPLTSLSETQSRIELDCISEEDAGLYECVANTNTGKRASVATEVNVVSKYRNCTKFVTRETNRGETRERRCPDEGKNLFRDIMGISQWEVVALP